MTITQGDICNVADDNTLYSCRETLTLTEIKKNLIFEFRLNSLKANPGKFPFMVLGNKSHHKHIFEINSIKAEATDDVLLLGITIH